MAKDFDNSEDEIVYIAVKDESDDEGDKMALISHVSKNDTWIIDSGCSHHMTRDRTKFEHFQHHEGKGHILLTNELVCDNSYWVEGLKNNLLSVAQLISIGFKVGFMHVKARLMDDKGKLIGLGK